MWIKYAQLFYYKSNKINSEKRKIALSQLIGEEDKTYIELEDFKLVYVISDEDLDRETDVKTSAVHCCRFEFNGAAKKAINMALK